MNKQKQHNFKVLCHERTIKRNLRCLLKEKLQDTGNETLLSNQIMSFLHGYCNKCSLEVSTLKYHRRYKNICFTCHKRYKR